MGLFRTDSIVLCCSNVEAAKNWWIDVFNCTEVKVPEDWDNPLASDVALRLPGEEPSILLSDRAEVQRAGVEVPGTVPVIFCNRLKKAYEYLNNRGVAVGPIQDGGTTQFFEIRDLEENQIEICEES